MDKLYKIGDKVWIMYNNQPKEVEVTSIANKQQRKFWGGGIVSSKIVYGLDWAKYQPSYHLHYILQPVFEDATEEFVSKHYLDDDMVFSTKEELVKSLL